MNSGKNNPVYSGSDSWETTIYANNELLLFVKDGHIYGIDATADKLKFDEEEYEFIGAKINTNLCLNRHRSSSWYLVDQFIYYISQDDIKLHRYNIDSKCDEIIPLMNGRILHFAIYENNIIYQYYEEIVMEDFQGNYIWSFNEPFVHNTFPNDVAADETNGINRGFCIHEDWLYITVNRGSKIFKVRIGDESHSYEYVKLANQHNIGSQSFVLVDNKMYAVHATAKNIEVYNEDQELMYTSDFKANHLRLLGKNMIIYLINNNYEYHLGVMSSKNSKTLVLTDSEINDVGYDFDVTYNKDYVYLCFGSQSLYRITKQELKAGKLDFETSHCIFNSSSCELEIDVLEDIEF